MPTTWGVVFTGPGAVSFERVEVPEPAADEVLVRSAWSWISNGTEGSFLRGERADGETPSSPDRPPPYPIVPGYQRVGEVVAAGPELGFEPGEAVFVTVSRVRGMASSHGGHLLCAPAQRQQVRRIPCGPVAPEAFSGLVLTQVGYNCGMRPTVAAGEPAVVVGDGLVGHWSAQTLQQRGARVMLLGRHPERLRRFERRDGDAVAAVQSGEEPDAVRAWCGEGLRAVIDTVGSVPTMERLFPLLARDGHLVSAGFHGPAGAIDIQLLRRREATLHTPSGWTGPRIDETLAWVAGGRLTTLPLVTHTLPAPNVVEAWCQIRERRGETLGVLLDWREVGA